LSIPNLLYVSKEGISGLAVPFGPREVLTVPKLAIKGYVTEAAILASWSIMAAVALCRCDEEGLGDAPRRSAR